MPEPPEPPEPDAPSGAPLTRATALSYEPGSRAPQITATGTGYIAERIIEAARAAGVPVRSDPGLAKALAALDLGAEIPEAMYKAVAEALAWAYRVDAARRPGHV
jgi:flagellar biosynthesis protein